MEKLCSVFGHEQFHKNVLCILLEFFLPKLALLYPMSPMKGAVLGEKQSLLGSYWCRNGPPIAYNLLK